MFIYGKNETRDSGRMAVVIKLREAIREMQTIRLSENETLILAEAAARYEITLVRLKERNNNPVQKM